MKKFCTLLIVFATLSAVKAQQQAQYSQYMVNPFLINPAFSSSQDWVDIMTGFRNQWTSFTGSPETFYVTGHAPIGKPHVIMTHPGDYHNWHGVGGKIIQDRTGPISQTSFYGNYSYNLKLTEGHGFGLQHQDGIRMSMGVFLGAKQFSLNQGYIKTDGDEVGESTDPTVLASSTQIVPDGSFGAEVYFGEKFWLSLAAFQLFGNKLNLSEDGESRLNRHYFYGAGAKMQIQNDLYFIPTILVKNISPAPVSVDLNARIDWKDFLYGGLSYRHGDAIAALAGVVVDLTPDNKRYHKLEVAYSYDFTTTDIRNYSNGTHEIILGFHFMPNYRDRNAEDTWGFWKRTNHGSRWGNKQQKKR